MIITFIKYDNGMIITYIFSSFYYFFFWKTRQNVYYMETTMHPHQSFPEKQALLQRSPKRAVQRATQRCNRMKHTFTRPLGNASVMSSANSCSWPSTYSLSFSGEDKQFHKHLQKKNILFEEFYPMPWNM